MNLRMRVEAVSSGIDQKLAHRNSPVVEFCCLTLEAWLFRGLLEGKAKGEDARPALRLEEAGARGVRCSASRISASLEGPPGVDMVG